MKREDQKKIEAIREHIAAGELAVALQLMREMLEDLAFRLHMIEDPDP